LALPEAFRAIWYAIDVVLGDVVSFQLLPCTCTALLPTDEPLNPRLSELTSPFAFGITLEIMEAMFLS
jgi:hypothetical protein